MESLRRRRAGRDFFKKGCGVKILLCGDPPDLILLRCALEVIGGSWGLCLRRGSFVFLLLSTSLHTRLSQGNAVNFQLSQMGIQRKCAGPFK